MTLDEFHPATTHNPARYGRTWEVRLPWTKPPLSLNDRGHWAVKAKRTREVRDAAHFAVLFGDDHELRGIVLDRASITLTYVPRDARRRDRTNLVATYKACVDGCIDAHVLPDDSPQYLIEHMPVILPPDGDPRLVLTIREVL